jgi:hypothetical protein
MCAPEKVGFFLNNTRKRREGYSELLRETTRPRQRPLMRSALFFPKGLLGAGGVVVALEVFF